MAGGQAGGTVPGGFSASVVREPFTAPSISESFSSLSLSSSLYEEPSSEGQRSGKNPWKIARRYQQDLCKKALEENIIVYLGTGCGKTHIAVLLLYEFGSFVRSPKKSVCVFLAPTVALVEQQARVIEDSLDLKVGVHCGTSKHLKSHCDWEKIIIEYEVLVMTPQILLRNLNHCFIRIQSVALLIFDECHHAQIRSNHPYAEIMKVFRKSGHSKLPHIFGMTASPVVGKGASCQENLPKCINSLENLLNAKVYTVDHKNELASFVASPKVKVYYYGPTVISRSCSYTIYSVKLEDIRLQCLSMLSKDTTIDHKSLKNKKKLLWRIHDNMIFSLRSLGLLGALQASHILRKSNHSERIELIEADGNSSGDSLLDKYASEAASMLASYCSQDSTISCISYEEALKEPFFSKKLLRLIGILSNFRVQPNMKCIIFVNRIITARCLSCMLQTLKFLVTWKCDFLVGVHSGLKSMSRKMMNVILEKFRSGELNLLVATKVGEEGLDIQTCCLVIRFDLPETVASFIQSRGRARMPQSEYAFLVDSDNQKELGLIESFENNENRINREVSVRTSSEIFVEDEEKVYKVDISGATISSGYSISLLHEYCSKLPHDEYFDPKPEFFYCDDIGGTVCHIILPSNAAIHQVSSTPQSSVDAAKGDACLIACKNLHEVGVLNDFLLPQKNASVDDMEDFADSDGSESDGLRAELHEMLVPALLKERWNDLDVSVLLNSYFIKFTPSPEDRQYRNFGLFLKTFLPEEAVRMKIDLHLFHGRSVMTELLPSGVVEFGRDEVLQAQNFQEMFLKVILDRSEFVHEFVPLGKGGIDSRSSSTYYLLLPVTVHECDNTVSVDWEVIGRCLSSPTFANPVDSIKSGIYNLKNHLQLANGPRSIDDIVNGLVYVPHKRSFFFVSRVLTNTNAYSPHKQTNHVEHLCQKFGIRVLYPEQPLLEVKQLFSLHNLLHNRKQDCREAHELAEHFFELPPELCQLKIIGFSKDIGSSLSLLPSVMHHLENLLVAIELKQMLSASFQEGAAVTAYRILEALTTEKCMDRFSLERLEILGDAFLKFAVGRHLFLLHDSLDEGELTWRRSNAVNNSNLFKLATRKNLQVYIRDWPFDPCQFIALGRPCSVICCKETEKNIHSHSENNAVNISDVNEVRCSKNHHLLRKKTIADVVEALVGAFIVDSGFKAASAFLSWLGIQVGFESTQVANACIASSYYMRLAPYIDIDALENLLGYRFIHKGLLLQAFVHPSYNKHGGGCYQRLEFLGDAVMDYLITSYLYSVYPKLKPGQMTDLRSVSVNNKAFAYVAIHRSFHKYLISDSSSLSEAINSYADFIKSTASGTSPCEGPKCPKALGDLVESCIGAILLDTGFSLTYIWDIVLSFLDPIMTFSSLQLSPIRELLELCQSYGWNMQFPTSKRGDTFLVAASVTGSNICATASVSNINRKDAIRIASQQLYEKLKGLGYELKSKSLEEVLRSSPKMEAKLIGYNETPTDLVSAIAALDEKVCGLTLNEDEPNVDPDDKIMIRLLDREDYSSREDFQRQFCEGMEGGPSKVTARSALYEICAANYWNRPYFECCKEEGSDHLKSFTFKVVVEIDDENNVLECLGKPCPKKKDASEHAAEAMLWYLNHQGYLPKSK